MPGPIAWRRESTRAQIGASQPWSRHCRGDGDHRAFRYEQITTRWRARLSIVPEGIAERFEAFAVEAKLQGQGDTRTIATRLVPDDDRFWSVLTDYVSPNRRTRLAFVISERRRRGP